MSIGAQTSTATLVIDTDQKKVKLCFSKGECWVRDQYLSMVASPCRPDHNGGTLSVWRVFAYTTSVYRDDPRWSRYNFEGVDFETVRADALLAAASPHTIAAAPGYYFLHGSVGSGNYVTQVTVSGQFDGGLLMLLDEKDQHSDYYFRVFKSKCPELQTATPFRPWPWPQLCQPVFLGGDPLVSHGSKIVSMWDSVESDATFKSVSVDTETAVNGIEEFDPPAGKRREVTIGALAANTADSMDSSVLADNKAFLGPAGSAFPPSGEYGTYVEMWGWGRRVVIGVTIGGAGTDLPAADITLAVPTLFSICYSF